jgi:hypothetical protein
LSAYRIFFSRHSPTTPVKEFRMRNFITKSSLALLGAIAFSGAAFAQAAPEGPGPGASGPGGRHHGPPPEAIAACVGKAAGTSVTFTGRMGSMTGICKAGPDGVLAARPEHGGGHGPMGGASGPGAGK